MNKILKISTFVLVFSLLSICFLSGKGYSLSSQYFDAGDSTASNVKLRVGNSANVQTAQVFVTAYFTNPTGNSVVISDINYCVGSRYSSYTDFAENVNTYNTMANTNDIVSVFKFDGVATYLGKAYSPDDAPDCRFAQNVPLPRLNPDPETGLYSVKIEITPYGPAQNIVGNYFRLSANGAGAIIAQNAGTDGNRVTVRDFNNTDGFFNYEFRFGSDCSVTSRQTKSLWYYDLDNAAVPPQGPGNTRIKMQLVRYNRAGARLGYWNDGAKNWQSGLSRWQPSNGNSVNGHTDGVTFDPGYRYIWTLINVRENNTIQLSTPYDGIFYDVGCQPANWTVSENSTVSAPTAKPGDTVNFFHTVTNDASSTGPATFKAQVEQIVIPPAAAWTNVGAAIQVNNLGVGRASPNNYKVPFTIPASAAVGTQYCQRVVAINGSSAAGAGAEDGARVCVTVTAAPAQSCSSSTIPSPIQPGDSGVTLKLQLTGSGASSAAYSINGTSGVMALSGGSGSATITAPNQAGSYPVTVTSPAGVGSCGTVDVYDLPYFKAYGAGVDSCSGTVAGWYNDSTPNGYGSSSQLSAIAVVNIVGFASAQTIPGFNNSPTGLTFANSVAADKVSDPLSPLMGGNSGLNDCPTTLPAAPSGPSGPASPVSGVQLANFSYNYSSSVEVDNLPIGNSQSDSIFVTGDAYINGNIIYTGSGSWATVDDVPSFTLVASGNIYIDQSVTRLDGTYIAGSQIFTCATGQGRISTDLYNDCGRQLTVYGSFQAHQINLMRTYGTLKDASGGEHAGMSCANNGGASSGRDTCAAEVFDFSPEVYLVPAKVGSPSPSNPAWDSVTSLPPIL